MPTAASIPGRVTTATYVLPPSGPRIPDGGIDVRNAITKSVTRVARTPETRLAKTPVAACLGFGPRRLL
jgi:hypothetical protein